MRFYLLKSIITIGELLPVHNDVVCYNVAHSVDTIVVCSVEHV